jgi:hypothetical protein
MKRVSKAVAAARAWRGLSYDKRTGVIVTLYVLIHCLSASRRPTSTLNTQRSLYINYRIKIT